MSEKEGLAVTPAMVTWSRERAGFSAEEASHFFKKIDAWEAAEALPSYAQIELMAEKFKVPVATFFFPQPPNLPPLEASFRTISAADFAAIPRTVRTFIRRGQAMQINLAELNDGKNDAARLITRDLQFSTTTSLDKIASEVRSYIGVSIDEQCRWKGVEDALEKWRDTFFSKAGIYVFKDAFRMPDYFGFCLFDDEFPIVYVNNSSAKSRQIFTMFHELGHLLFHTSGIDVVDDSFFTHVGPAERRIEVICNGLAARVLVPDDEFEKAIKGHKVGRDAAVQVAALFNVSREVIYRKFLDRALIGAEEYVAASAAWSAQMKPPVSGEGNYYNSHRAYLGKRYVDLAFKRFNQRRFGEGELAHYLNIKPKNLATFEAKFGGAA